LFSSQRFCRRAESTRTAGTTLTGRTRTAAIVTAARTARRSWAISITTAGTTRTTRTALGRHSGLIVDLSRSDDKCAVLAVAGDDDFAVFAALQDTFQIVEAQIAFGPLLAVAAQARSLEERLDVFGVSEVFLFSGRGKLAEIEFVEIEFVSRDSGRGGCQ